MAGRIRQFHAFFCLRSSAQILATAAPDSSLWLPDSYAQNFRRPLRAHDDALISTTPRDAAWTAAAKVLAVREFVGSYER
jgi:hypothetical protein